MARRFALESDGLDFATVNQLMPKGSAVAGTLKAVEENKDDAQTNVTTDGSEKVEAESVATPVKQETETVVKPVEETKEEVKQTPKEIKPKSKKEPKKLQNKEVVEEKAAEPIVEQVVVEETPKTVVPTEKAFPSFKEILYNEVGSTSEKESVTIRINPDILAQLDWLTNELPKGKKSSRGQIIDNLLAYFFEKNQKEIQAMELLSKE